MIFFKSRDAFVSNLIMYRAFACHSSAWGDSQFIKVSTKRGLKKHNNEKSYFSCRNIIKTVAPLPASPLSLSRFKLFSKLICSKTNLMLSVT